ncbi:putative DNA polymerase family B [Leishmania naiffi]|uniref:DNA-directed DNA polymerase n=1 Tax=Leishmania naiffi TaxID=5678 RepID=A0AAW3BNK5_9TRYP
MCTWDAAGHHNRDATTGAVAQHCDAPSSSSLPSCTLHAATSARGDEGHSLNYTAGSLRRSTTWCDRYSQRRACLHVHGVYPSLLLPQYDRNVSAEQLAAQLEAVALRIFARQGTFVPGQQLVHNIRIVRRFNVYGYRPHAQAFYEVELIDPDLLPRVVGVLQNSTEVGGRQWQLYDAHHGYHMQFMVRWRVNGVAPFLLPVERCHVRLPTVLELSENPSIMSASLYTAGGLQVLRRRCSDDNDAAKRELREKDEEEHRDSGVMSAQRSQLLFRRRWRPDELDRFTTAEVELDVAGADLLDHSSALEEEVTDGAAAAAVKGRRRTVTADDNLSYTRRIIRHYFREHGMPDALRVADAIVMEHHQRECAHLTADVSRQRTSPLTATAAAAVVPESKEGEERQQRRCSSVMQLQRGDATVRWLRQRMLTYLAERAELNAGVTAALVASSPKTENGGEASTSMHLAKTNATATWALPLSSTAFRVGSAAKLQEQPAIRQSLLSEYRQPGGATTVPSRHGYRRGATEAVTTHAYTDAHIVVRSSCTHVPNLAAAIVGGDALYVGFSPESLQLSVSQGQARLQQPQPAAAPGNAVAQSVPSSSHLSSFDKISPTTYANVVAAPTQDLLMALAQPSTPPVPSQASATTTSVAAAATTTPRGSSMDREEASEVDCRDMRSAQERNHEVVSNADVTLACASSAAPTAATSAPAGSSWSSWSSWSSASSLSSTASSSSGRASLDHDGDWVGHCRGVDPSFLRSSAAQPHQRAQEKPCSAAFVPATVVSDAPAQRLLRSSVCPSPRANKGQHGDLAFDALDSVDTEVIRRSGAASQEDGSLLPLESDASNMTSDELVSTKDGPTPEGQRRCAGVAATASLVAMQSPHLLPTRHGFVVGDCVAFVCVRDVASFCHLGEVLAVARVAALAAEMAELQWLLRLSETHLAAEEHTLVRRGSWLRAQRPSATATASTASSMRDHHSHTAGVAHHVQLGEMVLGDVRDSVPISILGGDARAALTYAAAPSASTQRLPAGEAAVSAACILGVRTIGLTACETGPEERSVSRQPRPRRPSDDAAAEVQVWRAHCFTTVAAYQSAAGPPRGGHWPHTYYPSCSSLPLLRVLCRYAYHAEARVLTGVSPDVFTSGAQMSAVDKRPRPPSRRISSRGGKQLESGERTTDTTPVHRSSYVRASLSRVCFSQPQLLVSSGSPLAHSKAAVASLTSAQVPSSPSVEPPATFAMAPRRESSEDGGEDTLLFPSSSASAGSSRGDHRDAPKRREVVTPPCTTRSALLDLTPMPGEALLQSPSETSSALPSPSASAQPPQHAADSASPPVIERPWRVSLARTPPPDFAVGSIRVQRSVQAAHRLANHTFISEKQARWHRRGACWASDRNNSGAVTDTAAAGATSLEAAATQLPFSNVIADADGDGGGGQPLGATVSIGSPVTDADGGDTVADVGGRGTTEVVVASAASSCVRSSSAAPLGSLITSSLTFSQLSPSSVEAVREVTTSQRGFLDFLQARRHIDEGAVRTALLQHRGHLGCIADGMARCFAVTTCGRYSSFCSRWSGSDDTRVRVSAVTWPWTASTEVTPKDGALTPPRYETVASLPAPPANITGVARSAKAASATLRAASADHGTKHLTRSLASRRTSVNHVPALSLSVTQQPQHYLQCTLRALYVEVLLHRRPGEALVSTSEVLAVGLGQATTATNSTIAVRVLCVKAAMRSSGVSAAHQAAASSSWGSLPSTAGSTPALVGLTGAVQVMTVPDEAALLARVRDEILTYDPDILISWDGFKYGLGHLALRYRVVLQRNLASDLSRVLRHHSYHQLNADGVWRPAAAASASGGNGGADSGVAEPVYPSMSEEGLAEIRRGAAEAGKLAAARYRPPPPASDAASLFAIGDDSSSGSVYAQQPLQNAISMAAHSSTLPSAAASASSAALLNDLDEDGESMDDGGADNAGAKGGVCGRRDSALVRQTAELSGRRVIHWAHTGLRRNGQSPLLARPRAEVDLSAAASTSTPPAPAAAAADKYAKRFGASMHVVGRICMSLGKDLRKHIKMPSYSLPMVHVELLGQPLPYFTDNYLSELFLTPQCTDAPVGGERHTALRYLASRVAALHRIACKLHWFTKLLEFSRMYGVLTKEVISRGSQFRVEATFLRLAQPLGYAMLSPSLSQVHRQPRIECIPLVMQPKSDLYRHDPVVVLDFRSLYPSVIIAYNLCYSTCLGMVQPQSHGRLGVLPRFKQSDATLAELLSHDGAQHDGVVFTLNGAMFVPPSTRVGLLPQMMKAVLDARFEVQAALKHIAAPLEDMAMQQRLQEQQLALKMLANVTYGYTAASYTGRMPCVDLAEAIVSLGRQTLERAIALIHSTPAWRAEVVYGDTDSLFVRLSGRTKADAFRIGQEIADAVTQSNPTPIRLQLEKVLLPCLLLVKKRYAGYMWSSPTQAAPTFLAKGIETVRRDQCPATALLVERLLRLLFDGASATALRQSYYAAVERLQSGAANPIQCIFRRGVRLGRYRDSGDAHLPLAARLALDQMEKDVTQTPYWGERLPYVVVRSTTANKLADKVLHPERLLQVDDTHSLDATYYIVRHINSALDRLFYLVGISFAGWYEAMPRRRTAHAALLSLPMFMAAQQRQQQLQGVMSPDGCAAAPFLFSSATPSTALSSQSQQVRLEKLESLMKELHHPHGSTGLLSFLGGGGVSAAVTTAAAAEVISDCDDQSGEVVQLSEVEDLTRSSIQEVIDVDQLATQHSCRPSSSLTDAVSPPLELFLKPDQAASRSGRQHQWRTVTLDSFYPRTLCVVCEKEAVSLADISRQQAVLMHVGVGGFDAAASGRLCPAFPCESATTAPAAPLPPPLLFPPICTRCWSDPLSLYLRVQQQYRSISQQMNALQGLCARCISSGGDAGDTAADEYKLAIADMEDMEDFCTSTLVRRRAFPRHSYEGVDGSTPRHVLAAVELSAEGVPRGCVSVDCAVGFEKKWVAAQQTQWQSLQLFLKRVL